jgi:hypothetical protein
MGHVIAPVVTLHPRSIIAHYKMVTCRLILTQPTVFARYKTVKGVVLVVACVRSLTGLYPRSLTPGRLPVCYASAMDPLHATIGTLPLTATHTLLPSMPRDQA